MWFLLKNWMRCCFVGNCRVKWGKNGLDRLSVRSGTPLHLNYWYGVVVEEALQLSVENGIRKNHRARCYQDNESLIEETFRHIYGETRVALAAQFIDAADCLWGGDAETFTLTGYKEFTYWLFKRRLKKWHPARVASDTRRGLEMLRELQNGTGVNAAVDAPANSQSTLALLIPAGKS